MFRQHRERIFSACKYLAISSHFGQMVEQNNKNGHLRCTHSPTVYRECPNSNHRPLCYNFRMHFVLRARITDSFHSHAIQIGSLQTILFYISSSVTIVVFTLIFHSIILIINYYETVISICLSIIFDVGFIVHFSLHFVLSIRFQTRTVGFQSFPVRDSRLRTFNVQITRNVDIYPKKKLYKIFYGSSSTKQSFV